MNADFNAIQPTIRTDCVDIIVISNDGITKMRKLFEEAASAPEKWMMHHFIVVYDTSAECKELKTWVDKNRELMPLPKITPCLGAPKNLGNVGALRQQATEQGNNPYVYFQYDDDPLPEGLERRIKIMDSSSWVAIYGITQNVSPRGQVIEEFPLLINGDFAYEPIESTKLFPTYCHPLAALFKRELFDKVPMNDEKRYDCASCNAFSVRLFNSGLPLHFLPDVIRKVRHHSGNNNGILEASRSANLATDIETWINHVTDPEIQEFQRTIANGLRSGTITTYREIDAQVESKVEGTF